MKKTFTQGDYVSCKRWSGKPFLGIYEHAYIDSSHCVLDVENGKRFNVHPKDIELANEEEIKTIKKLAKENDKTSNDKETPKEKTELDAALEATE